MLNNAATPQVLKMKTRSSLLLVTLTSDGMPAFQSVPHWTTSSMYQALHGYSVKEFIFHSLIYLIVSATWLVLLYTCSALLSCAMLLR